jgi:hypothetical protein
MPKEVFHITFIIRSAPPQLGSEREKATQRARNFPLAIQRYSTVRPFTSRSIPPFTEAHSLLREDGGVGYIPFSGQIVFGIYTILSRMSVGWWIGSNRYFEFFRAQIENAVFRYGMNRLLFFSH